MKLMQILEFYKRITEKNKNRRIPCENYENHEMPRSQLEIIENHEKLRIP